MLPCIFKSLFHFDCPGCGFQRSVLALWEGELLESLSLYPATLPILTVFGFTLLHLKFQFSRGAMVIKYLQFFAVSVILVFYIYKIVTHKAF